MILADENIGGAIVTGLRDAGFDVKWIAEISPTAPDSDILELAHREGRILLTDDKDLASWLFGMAAHMPASSCSA